MAELLFVGPVPPPTGGIASHVAGLRQALVREGLVSEVVDPRDRLRFVSALGAARTGGIVHVHVCGHNAKSFGLAAACRAAARTVVISLHSGLAPRFLARLTRGGRRVAASILGRADAVVAVSEPIAAALRPLGVEAVVATPFVAAGLAPGRLPARARGARQAARILVGAALAPGAEYGAPVLVGGFARLAALVPGSLLVVFGPGGADRDVARELEARGLGERVQALGELDPREAAAVLAACDLFLRPTFADGDALSVREALALGVRVVASDAAARPAGVATFPAGDWRKLAAAAVRALEAPAPRAMVAGAPVEDGYPALRAIYARLGAPLPVKEVASCAASPAG